MTKEELISGIKELAGEDSKFDLESLRVKELNTIYNGLTLPAEVKEKDGKIVDLVEMVKELNAELSNAENAPKNNKAGVKIGKNEKGESAYLTSPKVRIDGVVYTAKEVAATKRLSDHLIQIKAGNVVFRKD